MIYKLRHPGCSSLQVAIKFYLEYLGFRVAGFILGSLSLETSSSVSGWLWRMLAPRFHRHERAISNLHRAFPEKSDAECEAIALDMWDNLGRVFAEAFHLQELASNERITFVNADVVESWLEQPGGKIACAGHLANWEVVSHGMIERGLKPCCPYQSVRNPHVDREILAIRRFLYPGGLVAKSPELPRLFMKLVKQGGTVAILCDLAETRGIKVPFFGRPAPTSPLPAALARVAATKLLVVCSRRLPGSRFEQTFELVAVPATGDRKKDIEEGTARVHAVFERFIRQHPEQWMWANRRWGSESGIA